MQIKRLYSRIYLEVQGQTTSSIAASSILTILGGDFNLFFDKMEILTDGTVPYQNFLSFFKVSGIRGRL